MFADVYKDKNYQFPSDDIDPKLKLKPKWYLDWCNAVYSNHVRDQGGVRYTKLQDIDLNRQYAEGRQPVEKYLDIVCPKDKKTGKRKSFMDISTDILSIIPKFRSIVIGKFMQYEHEIIANAVDENSGAEKQNKRLSLWADAQIAEALKPYQAMLQAGVDQQQASEFIPRTVEELDILESTGSFKLKWEAGMEKLIKDTFRYSDWNDIKNRLYEDLFDLGIAATRDYTDKVTGKAKTRYVDIKRLIVRHSNRHVYDNIDYAGEVLDMTPNDIRIQAGEDIPLEELNEIIEKYADVNHLDYAFNENVNDLYEKYGHTDVKVLDLVFKSIDSSKQEAKKDRFGHTRYYNKDYDYELTENQKKSGNRKVTVAKKQMVYRCKWIIGTKYVFDYGLEEDIIRKDAKTVELPFNIYRLSRKSILESIIPLEDNIQLAWLKFQNALAKAAPGGIAVDVGALKNVTNGENRMKPLELLTLRRQTGDLLFKSTTHHSQVINPNAGRPIIELPGGAGAELDEHIKVIDFNINMIRQITGINEMLDASAPPPNTLVGTAEIAQQGTNNTLYNLYNAYKTIKENTADNLAHRVQSIIRYKDYKLYEPVIGTGLVNVFKQNSPIAHADYGIALQLKPQAQEKTRMLQMAQQAFAQGLLKYSDYILIEEEITNGSLKKARMYLMYKEEKYREEKQQEALMNTQAQSQAIQEQQQMGMQVDMAKMDKQTENNIKERAASSQLDVQEYAAKNEFKKEEDDNKSQNKIKENLYK